ncbi:glycosyl hydrolase-related protein [Lachnospiraceae bacterium OttesenSCG-928-D06]|nr:glycosyl hydrolase-related protein [Lachnospiraceae bacterium OttesenSCG-928-D06]
MPYYNKNTLSRIETVFKRLQSSYYEKIGELTVTAFVTKEPVEYNQRETGEKKSLKIGDEWGGLFDCAWFHFAGSLPVGYEKEECCLIIDISGEGLCVDGNGDPLLGITNGSVVWENAATRKRTVPLSLLDIDNGNIDMWMDAGCNGLFGDYITGGLREAHIAKQNPERRNLFYDFFVLKEAMEQLSDKTARYHCILRALNDACNVLYDYSQEEVIKARSLLSKELKKTGGSPSLTITGIGHAHIDLAWLWPVRETVRKGARTFATVDKLMDRYPEYKFGFSQPQLLLWMKEYYPALYKRMQKRVQEGRIECQGAMWVEADTNLAGGEALVRQIIHGLNFWKEEFDFEVDNIWIPDVFGYTASLPQIIKKSGLKYFMTQKLSWSEHNEFPHHTFHWVGIDGSSVLTHMLPENTYNSLAGPAALHRAEEQFLDKGVSGDALMLFGVGDGGGGPSAAHLEKLERLHDLNGFPNAKQGFAKDMFAKLEEDKEKYHSWKGELYLEFHRGTYTSQARNKQYNRRMEQLLRETEYAATLAMLYGGKEYPKEELDALWQEVLLYQFHDIVPGSSIKRVYDESLARYEIIFDQALELMKACYGSVLSDKRVMNSLSFPRKEYMKLEDKWILANMPAMGSAGILEINITEEAQTCLVSHKGIENEFLQVSFGENGEITSIFDKVKEQETLTESANIFSVYDDSHGDAWDIRIYYEEQAPKYFKLVSKETYCDGPEVVRKQVFSFGTSTLTQKVILKKDCPYVIFDTSVEWQETEKMLRTAFPVNVYTDEVTCDIQFGTVKRKTHRNTSWDMTKFEICAHKWIDLSKDDYGVALLSDSKYGFKALDNIMDINLLRSSMYPGVDADKGFHSFRYAFYPHEGNEKVALVEQKALAFNIQPVIALGDASESKLPANFLTVNRDNIEITTVKKAEKSEDVIVRFYQTDGLSTDCVIGLPDCFTEAFLCNLVEEEMEELKITQHSAVLKFAPFEIHTILLRR